MKKIMALLIAAVQLNAAELLKYFDGNEVTNGGQTRTSYAFRGNRAEIMSLAPVRGVWSLSVWVKRVEGPWGMVLLSDEKYAITLESVNTGERFRHVGLTVYGARDYAFAYRIPLNEWHFLTFTRDGSGISLYVDAIFRDRLAVSFPLPMSVLGARWSAPRGLGGFCSADLDDLSVWNGTLTHVEMEDLWTNGPSL